MQTWNLLQCYASFGNANFVKRSLLLQIEKSSFFPPDKSHLLILFELKSEVGGARCEKKPHLHFTTTKDIELQKQVFRRHLPYSRCLILCANQKYVVINIPMKLSKYNMFFCAAFCQSSSVMSLWHRQNTKKTSRACVLQQHKGNNSTLKATLNFSLLHCLVEEDLSVSSI